MDFEDGRRTFEIGDSRSRSYRTGRLHDVATRGIRVFRHGSLLRSESSKPSRIGSISAIAVAAACGFSRKPTCSRTGSLFYSYDYLDRADWWSYCGKITEGA